MNEQQKAVLEGIRENKRVYGKPFCPCVLPANYTADNAEDYVCKCKEYRDTGVCHCGLYEAPKQEVSVE